MLSLERVVSWSTLMWEYKKIDLNSPPRKKTAMDLLNEAGQEGWELISVNPLGSAYFKRQKPQTMPSEVHS